MGICMCPGIATNGFVCPKKETCHRHTRIPNEYRQAYFCNPPVDITTGQCDYYVSNKQDEGE